jgi:FkbM family methyltransferase
MTSAWEGKNIMNFLDWNKKVSKKIDSLFPNAGNRKRFLSYSNVSDREDWILHCVLSEVENGFYVDVGANDPWECSVTKHFYERGWRGINIEPLEDKYKELCLDRPRDITLNIGAGSDNGELEFFIFWGRTSCEADTFNNETKQHMEKKNIPVKRLADVLDGYIEKNTIIHFCKIDVEGFERSVLEGMDFHRFRPWIMVIEATVPGSKIPCHEKWEDLLLNNGYQFAFMYGVNRYYFDSRNSEAQSAGGKFDDIRALEKDVIFYKAVYSDNAVKRRSLTELMVRYYACKFLSKICPIKFFKFKAAICKQRVDTRRREALEK